MLRALAPWRRLFPNRTVRRQVQGVELYMPWSHLLPDYARSRDYYGQNLVDLAAALARGFTARFKLVDVGANVGDSALQVLGRVDGMALCVEADPYWTRYLLMNAGDDPRIAIEPALLTVSERDRADLAAVRRFGTTQFEHSTSDAERLSPLSVEELHARHPEFRDARLIKSDTDGFDTLLVPALARAWAGTAPVLFFEFDPELARKATGEDPDTVWDELAELGYTQLLVWDNTGDPLGRLTTEAAPGAVASLQRSREFGYDFWDVAACRADDPDALAAFDELVTEPFDPRGVH